MRTNNMGRSIDADRKYKGYVIQIVRKYGYKYYFVQGEKDNWFCKLKDCKAHIDELIEKEA